MKTTKSMRLTRVLVAAMTVCLLIGCMLPMFTLAAGDAINDAKTGVLQVNLVYTDDTNSKQNIAWGTGFLINDNTVITSHHVVNLTDSELSTLAASVGKSVAEFKNRLSVTVTVSRDVAIPATIQTESYAMDFAVLHLSSSLQGKTPLKIRSSSEVKQAEVVYAIGFPDTSAQLQSYNTYTSDDATITQGIVNKIGVGVNLYSNENTNYIQTSCNLDYGNSGGPMVDENGYVVGICQGTIGDEVTEYYNAVAIDQVTEVLDALGVVYSTPTPDPVVTTPSVETPVVTDPVVPDVPATLPPIDTTDANPDNSGNMVLILAIAAIAVVVIVVVVIVILASGKKKTPAMPMQQMPVAPVAPVAPGRPNGPVGGAGFAPVNPVAPPQNTYPMQAAGETTVLGGGSAGETTVLSRNAVSGGTLIRKRTGEAVAINAEQFVIGRERKGVNYCIADNSSISRNHVRLTVRGGVTYLSDLNAANGTFVNGVKVMPRQEVALKNGDKITLADEDLEYKN